MNDFDRKLMEKFTGERIKEKKEQTLEEFRDGIAEIAEKDPNFDLNFSKTELDEADRVLYQEFEAGNWSSEFISSINMRSEDIDNQLLPSQQQLTAYMRGKIVERAT